MPGACHDRAGAGAQATQALALAGFAAMDPRADAVLALAAAAIDAGRLFALATRTLDLLSAVARVTRIDVSVSGCPKSSLATAEEITAPRRRRRGGGAVLARVSNRDAQGDVRNPACGRAQLESRKPIPLRDPAPALRPDAGVRKRSPQPVAPDDDQERWGDSCFLAKEQSWRTAWRARSLLSRTTRGSEEPAGSPS
jgi:hypothetical protein